MTLEGLDPERIKRWGDAFCAAGGSQCGFCTPGIIVRLDALAASAEEDDRGATVVERSPKDAVDQALLAHLCRCTGWQTIHEAWELFTAGGAGGAGAGGAGSDGAGAGSGLSTRNMADAQQRAGIEGRSPQAVSPNVALGLGGFAADTAPEGHLVAVSDGSDGWVVAETLTEARLASGKVQGRRTTAGHGWPLEIPPGDWDAALRTTWTDAAYLETDASWCEPGQEPVSAVANGGAFGAKSDDARVDDIGTDDAGSGDAGSGDARAFKVGGARALDVRAAAKTLADEHGRPVLVLASREDVAERSPKRPPVAGGMNADGSGVLRVASTPNMVEIVEAVASIAPGLAVEEVPVVGPPTSARLRAVGWAEAVVLRAGASKALQVVRSPEGAEAEAVFEGGVIKVNVGCGRVLDETVLRSFCIGAAHMAWSWLLSEAMVVDESGTVHDLTVRSFGVLRAVDTPPIEIEITASDREPVNGSDAVFAAVAAAGWLANDCRPDWPVGGAVGAA